MASDKIPSVISHYLVESLLGVGGMGVVYSGVDQRDGSPVAIKLLHRHLSDDPEFRERFEREAHLAALLRSPYTVQLIEYGIADGRCFMVMEYIDGETLGQTLRQGPLPAGRALRVAAQAARALEEAHARGVVHRDIKPENILLLGDSAKVADFGIARRVGAATQTLPGGFYGTISYAAPEQLTGEADHRTDIWALGATLFHMLAGRSPFTGPSEEVLKQIATDPAPLELLKEQPEDALSIIARCLEKAPEDRYASAAALAAELEQAARRLSTSAGVSTAEPATSATVVVERGPVKQLLSLRLTPLSARSSIALRLRPAGYALEARNDGDAPVELELRAEDRGGGCRFSLPARLALGARSTARTIVKVWPQKRRWRGKPVTRIFTVFGAGGDGPPVTASSRFEDLPFGWVPYAGAVGAGATAALLAGGAFAAGLVGPEPGPEPLRIGLVVPFSGARDDGGGSFAEYGQAYLNAARIAVGEINEGGGVLGQPVILVQGDSAGDPNVGTQEARRLVQDEAVQAIIGDYTSLDIANAVTNPAGVVHISPYFHTEAEVRDLDLDPAPPFLFKTQVQPEAEGVVLSQLLLEGGYGTVCSVFDIGSREMINETLKRLTPEVRLIEVEHLVEGSSEQSPEEFEAAWKARATEDIQKCAGADAVVLSTFVDCCGAGAVPVPPTSYILEEALIQGLGPVFVWAGLAEQVYFGQGESAYAFDEIGWDRVAAVKGTRAGDPTEGQGVRFDESYKQQFGDPPTELADPARFPADLRSIYDAVYLLALAAEKAGSTDPDPIRRALPDVANAPGTVVKPGPIGRDFSEGGPGRLAGRFEEAIRLLATGEDIDYEGAAGPIEFDSKRDNVRGVVEIWRIDPQGRDLVAERTLIVDLSKDEAVPVDVEALRTYFETYEMLVTQSVEGTARLYETYPEAFKGYPEPGTFQGDIGQSQALHAEYVGIFQEFLDRFADLVPPREVQELHGQTLAANETLQSLNRERLSRLNEAKTATDVDAIFAADLETSPFTAALEEKGNLCLEAETVAAAHGIQFDGRCE